MAVVAPLFIAAVAAAAFSQLFFRTGWPTNHDFLNWKFITQVYAQHLAQGDLLPVWSAEDNFGAGSPFPLLYHKLFFYGSSLVYSSLGNMKAAIAISLWFWSTVGGYGIYRLARYLGHARDTAACFGAIYLLQDYLVTDWLVRGAFSEFCAAHLLPYLALTAAVWLREGRIVRGMGLLVVFLIFAHSVIAYFAFLIFAAVLPLRPRAGRDLIDQRVPLCLHTLFITCALTPYVLKAHAVGGIYSVSALASQNLHPTKNFRLFPKEYLWDIYWHWGNTWEGVSSEISLATGIAFALSVGFNLASRRQTTDRRFAIWLGLGLGFVFFLQTKFSTLLYHHLPGFAYLQFPYRLLTIAQLFMVGLTAWATVGYPLPFARGFCVLLLVAMLVTYKGFVPTRYSWIARSELERPLQPGKEIGLSSDAGYYPRAGREYRFITEPSVIEGKCAVKADSRSRPEPEYVAFEVDCATEASIALPINYSGLEKVTWEGRGNYSQLYRTDEDPRVHIDVKSARGKLTIFLPTF